MIRGMHINALNTMARFVAMMRGVAVSPADRVLRAQQRKMVRNIRRMTRMYRWEHSGPRQARRYARQIAQGRLKIENGLAAY